MTAGTKTLITIRRLRLLELNVRKELRLLALARLAK